MTWQRSYGARLGSGFLDTGPEGALEVAVVRRHARIAKPVAAPGTGFCECAHAQLLPVRWPISLELLDIVRRLCHMDRRLCWL